MLTGVRPWDGESLFGVIYKQKTEQLPSLLQRRPDTPDHLRLLIERATEKVPAERCSTAQDFLTALSGPAPVPVARPWAESVPAVAAAAARAPAADYPTLEIEQALVDQAFADGDRMRRRKQRFMAAAVTVLLFSGGAGALAFSGRQPGEDGGNALESTLTPPSAYAGQQQFSPPTGPAVTDTPSFVLDQPVVDAGAAAAETRRDPEPARPVASRDSDARTNAAPPAQRAGAEQDTADSVVLPNPVPVLPALSVARPMRSSRPTSAPAVDTSRQQTETAEIAAPQLRNRERIGQLLADRYPTDLRTRGVGGTTVLTVLVAPDGTVERSSVVTSSGSDRLDEAARAVATRMIFSHPDGAPRQAVWVAVPLTFNPR
jgi:TonB family protein